MNIRQAACWILLSWLVAGVSVAEERFSDLVEVTEVEVPVRVLVKGKPLAGLQVADFELYDEGQPQSIVGFRVQESVRQQPQELSSQPLVDLDQEPAGRRLLLLFDFNRKNIKSPRFF